MNELISIIIPIYKVEAYLNRCIDSILRQTYRNLEVILIDDGSPDRCGEICDEYRTLDDRVKVIHKENGGVSDARNCGLEACTGEFIAFVDGDDFVHETYIEKLYNLLGRTKADISACSYIRVENDEIKGHILEEEIYEYSNVEALENFFDKFYIQMDVVWGKLYKRELFKDIKFPFGRIHEDDSTIYKVIYNAGKITLSTAELYYYYQRKDSIMGRGFTFRGRLDAIEAVEGRGNFFKSIGEIGLRDRTYRILFDIYKEVNDKIDLAENLEDEIRFKKKFIDFKEDLRKTNQRATFRIYYELYYLMPKVTSRAEKIYRQIQNNFQ